MVNSGFSDDMRNSMERLQLERESLELWLTLSVSSFGPQLIDYLKQRQSLVRRLYGSTHPSDSDAISRIQGAEEEINNFLQSIENVDDAKNRLDKQYEICINAANARENSMSRKNTN